MIARSFLNRALLAGALPLALLPGGCATAGAAVAPVAHAGAMVQEPGRTVLFIGNSFTFGAGSPAQSYGADKVTDLNGDGIGGVPALFKLLTEQAGLDYAVSLETSPGKSLEWHWQNRRELLDRPWDHVVMQEYSTLDRAAPGEPGKLVDYAGRFARLFHQRNPAAHISLSATWSRPDLVYRGEGRWSGTPIARMATDLRAAYDVARAADPGIARVNPVGEAFNCAMAAGYADPNPYDGIAPGQTDLWASDHYHASAAGYYLHALIVFGALTGEDPRRFGGGEIGAGGLGLSAREAVRLQNAAWATLNSQDCAALPSEPAP